MKVSLLIDWTFSQSCSASTRLYRVYEVAMGVGYASWGSLATVMMVGFMDFTCYGVVQSEGCQVEVLIQWAVVGGILEKNENENEKLKWRAEMKAERAFLRVGGRDSLLYPDGNRLGHHPVWPMKWTVSLKSSYSSIESGRKFRSSAGNIDDMGGLTITWWKATARGRVQEGQKFYGYKHPLNTELCLSLVRKLVFNL